MPAKKILQDIVPGEKRSIRNIGLDREGPSVAKVPRKRVQKARTIEDEDVPVAPRATSRETAKEEARMEILEELAEEKETVRRPSLRKKKNGKNIFLAFIITLLCLGVIATSLSLLYAKATVTITPKIANFNIEGTFTAKKEPLSSELGYEVVTATDETTSTIAATAGPLVQTKAKGTVVIYNNHSTTPQTLIAGTRLSTPEGLVYRTASSIVVPGKKASPGSVSVAIVADQAGENYNTKISDLSGDFKIVGYKGTDKYSSFYGRLKTDLLGGFSGKQFIGDQEFWFLISRYYKMVKFPFDLYWNRLHDEQQGKLELEVKKNLIPN